MGKRGRPSSGCALLPRVHAPPPPVPALPAWPLLAVTRRGRVFCLPRTWAHGEQLPGAPVHVPPAQQRWSTLPGGPGCRRWCPGAGVAPRAQRPCSEWGRGPVLTCLVGCRGTFFPRSHAGSRSCSGPPISRGRPFSLGSVDGQFSDSRGFLARRRSHFSFRSCGFRAMSFCKGRTRPVNWQ